MRLERGCRSLALRTVTALAFAVAPLHIGLDGPFVAKAYAKPDKSGGGSQGNSSGGSGAGGSANDGNGGTAGGQGSDGNGSSGQGNPGGGSGSGGSQAEVEDHVNPTTGDKVEVDRGALEVTHSNGMKEKVENGRFRMEDKYGRTIIDRKATAADVDRLNSL